MEIKAPKMESRKQPVKVLSIFDCYATMRAKEFEPGTRYIVINKKNLQIVADFVANDIDDVDPGEAIYQYQKQRMEE
jgi:hypothetical protein